MNTLYLLIAAIAGPILVGGGVGIVQELRKDWAVTDAVNAERERGERECTGKLNTVRAQSAETALEALTEASQAALGIKPTPLERAELEMLCETDLACREFKP